MYIDVEPVFEAGCAPMDEPEVLAADFARYFPSTPTALCIKECARLSSLRKVSLNAPLLDVGCGDGVFGEIAFGGLDAWGIDINADEIKLAQSSKAYERVILGDITKDAVPSESFASCVANCSLEHIPRLDLALANIYRALKPGGTFVTFVPNRDWAEQLLSYRLLSMLDERLAKKLQSAIDEFFVHRHLYDQAGWRQFVAEAGFEVSEVSPVLSSASTVAFELFLLPSLLGFVHKKLTRRWTSFPGVRQMLAEPAYLLVEGALSLGDKRPTAEFMVVARRPELTANAS
jgi:SAM-dependent methyltransferase